MLCLVVLLSLLAFIDKSYGINLTYIVKSENGKLHPSCIAEELERYAALGWIYPIPNREEDLPNITTKFIPELDNEVNCKFSKNSKCNALWVLKNWMLDGNSSRVFDLIFDTRWENLPTIFTAKSKDFKERIEIPSVFRVGFSVRAQNSIELVFCEGWNPYNYPCYHIKITKTEIDLHKHNKLPKNDTEIQIPLDSYQAFSDILTQDEWRNFVASLDENGTFTLTDVNVNRTVLRYHDTEPIKPLYLLVRSTEPALWKIHQNEYMYTRTAQISRLGPTLDLPSKDLCLTLYVSTCPNCALKFTRMKGSDEFVLKELPPTKKNEWVAVKLKEENVQSEKINVFVETKFENVGTNKSEGFWAIDDVRICHENEVKVSFLKLKDQPKASDDISCQVVKHPKWRPRKLVYPKIEAFPTIENSSNSTSIHLKWTQEDVNNQISYFIKYQANDICTEEPHNLKRIKSNGFLMTKLNDITIDNLIPYTTYNVTFSSVLHDIDKKLQITTEESALPTQEELPHKVQIQNANNAAYVSWDRIDCRSIYGHVLYAINVTNMLQNTTQELKVQTENTIKIENLQPFTLHKLDIATARTYENLENGTNVLHLHLDFTTRPATAPRVQNLELLSIDDNSASLRFDLPDKNRGIPKFFQLTKCNPLSFKKCKTSSPQPLQPCELYPDKYCASIDYLMANQAYVFKISVKNLNTQAFGEEANIEGYTIDRVPGAPSNVTYRTVDCMDLVDYCHLNISWLHPYNQNGTITGFNLILNNTSNDTEDIIKEFVKIDNKTYARVYTHQIKFIPYSTHYELFLQSVNTKFKSDFVTIHVKTADIGDHIDQKPKIFNKTDESVIFKLKPVDGRLKSYQLTVVVQDFDSAIKLPKEIVQNTNVGGNLCHNFGNTWISQIVEVTNDTERILRVPRDNKDRFLQAGTQYCVIFIIINRYKNTEHDVIYFEKLSTLESQKSSEEATTISPSSTNHLYALLLLLFLIPIGFLIYRFIKKRQRFRRNANRAEHDENNGNVYESLPFEECEPASNCVSNDTYDHLLHK